MIYTSLAVLALSASAAVSPLSKLVHLHPRNTQPDTRVIVTLHNDSSIFQDIKIDGHTYTIRSHQGLVIKAPAGTKVFAESSTGGLHRGDLVVELDAQLDQKRITLK